MFFKRQKAVGNEQIGTSQKTTSMEPGNYLEILSLLTIRTCQRRLKSESYFIENQFGKMNKSEIAESCIGCRSIQLVICCW